MLLQKQQYLKQVKERGRGFPHQLISTYSETNLGDWVGAVMGRWYLVFDCFPELHSWV